MQRRFSLEFHACQTLSELERRLGMKIKIACFSLVFLSTGIGLLFSQEGKPNFSGTWRFNKPRSELSGPTYKWMGPGAWGAGPGITEGQHGYEHGGYFVDYPRMGSLETSAPAMGRNLPGEPEMDDPRMIGVAESVVIEHEGPNLTVRVPMKIEGKNQTLESRYTIDGKSNRNTVPGGVIVKSKTRWDKNRLITNSVYEGPMGPLGVSEVWILSDDGKTMTVEQTMGRGTMDWKRKLVYLKD